jgi:hypothetical protein
MRNLTNGWRGEGGGGWRGDGGGTCSPDAHLLAIGRELHKRADEVGVVYEVRLWLLR